MNIISRNQKIKENLRPPTVLCVGFAKCGTTTLYDILKQNSRIYLSEIKEPVFYFDDKLEKKGFEWYLNRYYPKAPEGKVIVEINPLIAKYNIPEKIARDFGKNTKIIFLLRNPVSRLFSNFKMNLLAGETFSNKKQHLEGSASELFDVWIEKNFYYDGENLKIKEVFETDFCANGEYLKNIKGYYEHFPAENIKVYFFEDLIENPEEVCRDMFNFIGVEYEEQIDYHIHSNESNLKPTKIGMFILDFWFEHVWSKILIRRLPYVSENFSKKLNACSWNLPSCVSKHEKDPTKVSQYAKDMILKYYYNDIVELERYLKVNLFKKWHLE